MEPGNLTVAGRRFRTKTEYEAALRDEEQIKALRSRYDFKNGTDVLELFRDLQSGKYVFESPVGNDFDDEVFELAGQYKKAAPQGRETAGPTTSGRTSAKGGNNSPNKPASKNDKKALADLDPDLRKEVLAVIRKKERRRRILLIGCSFLALASFAYYGIYYFFMQRTERDLRELAEMKNESPQGSLAQNNVTVNKTGEIVLPEILDKYKNIYNKNKKLIGWLQIADTIIDYPVMQTTNNEYYLDHNANQEYDKNGSIFMDSQCSLYPRSDNLIIYGHHMKSGRMFGDLQKYAEESYYEKHQEIIFDTIYEEGTYEIMYVFRSRVYNEDEIVFKYYQFFEANSAEEFNSNMREMADMSLYNTGVTASYGDQLLTLSTCDNSQTEGRFVVVAKRIS